jgi:hypothetical protein
VSTEKGLDLIAAIGWLSYAQWRQATTQGTNAEPNVFWLL